MPPSDNLPILPFETARAFEQWIEENHSSAKGIWLKLAKASSGIPTVTYAEALDIALCFGWIDGQKNSLDETHWLQRFTPRQARSKWSKVNVGKVEALIASGRMRPRGQKEVDAAKKDGRWERAYGGRSSIEVPDDWTAALKGNKQAREFFEQLSSANRFIILYRIQDAKRPETRARRIAEFLAMCAEGKTPR